MNKSIKKWSAIGATLAVSMCMAQSVHAETTPNDPLFSMQQISQYTNKDESTDFQIQKAWDITTGDSTVVVAVIDSGVDITHPDLVDNIWTNTGEIPDNGIDDDHNGYIDDVHGWDFYRNTNVVTPDAPSDTFYETSTNHGTEVAGAIGARGNNGYGVAGINWQVKIMPLKVTTGVDDATDAEASARAIDYAVANGANVINMSYGEQVPNEHEKQALKNAQNKGVLAVAAIGNEGQSTKDVGNYPACYPSVIAVASVNQYNWLRDQGNYGPCADIATTGFHIYTTKTYFGPNDEFNQSFSNFGGTSAASPMVAGVAALMKAEANALHKDLPIRLWKQLLLGSTNDHIAAVAPYTLGAGRLNAYAAVKAVQKALTSEAPHITAFTKKDLVHQLIPGKPSKSGRPYFTWSAPEGANASGVMDYLVYFSSHKHATIGRDGTLVLTKTSFRAGSTVDTEMTNGTGKYYLNVQVRYNDGSRSPVSKFVYDYQPQ